jgi:hypothetical protein
MPTYEVEANGKRYQIEAPDENGLMTAVKSLGGQSQPAADPSGQQEFEKLPWYGKLGRAADDMVRLAADGASFGYADKISGYLNGNGTDKERALTAAARQRAGYAAPVAEIGGALGTGLGASGAGLTAAKLVPQGAKGLMGLGARTAAMGAEGAGYGALNAKGHDEDVGTGAMYGAAAGALGNVAGEAISAGVGKVAGAFNKQPKLPTPDELRAAKDAAYKTADEAGLILSPQVAQDAKAKVVEKLTDMGYHPQLQPKVATVLDELDRVGGENITLKGFDTVRKIASGAYVPGDKANNKMVSKIIETLDNRLAEARPGDVLAGDASGIQALTEARRLNTMVSKSDRVSEALDKATRQTERTGTGGNIDNNIRGKIDAILNSDSKKRGFSPDELQAMREIVSGTPTQNAMRQIGRLSPQGNGLMMAIHGAGIASNPVIALPAAGAGMVAKTLADRATPANVETLQKIIAAGGKRSDAFAAPNAVQRLSQSKRDALIRSLMMGGVVSSSGAQ